MNPYSSMLEKAVEEVRQLQQNSPDAKHFNEGCLEGIATRMKRASSINGVESVEIEVLTISRMVIDCGPLTEGCMPSFHAVLGAVQRARKRRPSTS